MYIHSLHNVVMHSLCHFDIKTKLMLEGLELIFHNKVTKELTLVEHQGL